MKKLEKQGSMNQRIDTVLNKFQSRMKAFPLGMCPLTLYRALLQVSISQSCGKCVPCRDGLPKVDSLLKDILDGNGTAGSCKQLEDLCLMISRTSDCATGVTAARPESPGRHHLDALPFPGFPRKPSHQPRPRRIRQNPGIQSLRNCHQKSQHPAKPPTRIIIRNDVFWCQAP